MDTAMTFGVLKAEALWSESFMATECDGVFSLDQPCKDGDRNQY
jgi:hypothetical protein